MRIKAYAVLLGLCLCLMLTSCGKANPITVPSADDVISITVISDEESVTYDDTEWIAQVISDISDSKPTNKQSVQDVPQVESYIQLDLRLGEGTSTLFIYKDGENCYIEQPYQGIYEINSELYDLICETVNE